MIGVISFCVAFSVVFLAAMFIGPPMISYHIVCWYRRLKWNRAVNRKRVKVGGYK